MTREGETTASKERTKQEATTGALAGCEEPDALAFMTQVPDEDEPSSSEALSKKALSKVWKKEKRQPLPQLRNP